MNENRDIAEKFYIGITNGETQVVEDLLSEDFELIVPMGKWCIIWSL